MNSLHLDPSRRQDFRRARDVLLQGRGAETICAEARVEEEDLATTFVNLEGNKVKVPASLDCWLVDREFLYPLKIGVNTMGRSSDNDVVVEDLYVSRRHCAILMHHDLSCVLHDTASKNGTLLNGNKIPGPTTLRPGDQIRICNREFVFRSRSEGDMPASPPKTGSTHTIAS